MSQTLLLGVGNILSITTYKDTVRTLLTNMDPDGADGGSVVTDSLNGETKPDPAKLAQSAIIKQVSSIYNLFFIKISPCMVLFVF